MQMCASVQIPQSLNGLEGQAVYIDTEGSFVTSRVVEITKALIKILSESFPNKDLKTGKIILSRCFDMSSGLGMMRSLCVCFRNLASI